MNRSVKIRTAELAKVPYTLVVGEKEIASAMWEPRIRKDMRHGCALSGPV